jgi:hypothetical protein
MVLKQEVDKSTNSISLVLVQRPRRGQSTT